MAFRAHVSFNWKQCHACFCCSLLAPAHATCVSGRQWNTKTSSHCEIKEGVCRESDVLQAMSLFYLFSSRSLQIVSLTSSFSPLLGRPMCCAGCTMYRGSTGCNQKKKREQKKATILFPAALLLVSSESRSRPY